jgi:RNA polymerase primary sigma factor
VINQTLAEQIRKMIATLTPREERVLRLRFGIGEKDDHTLDEISRTKGDLETVGLCDGNLPAL